MNESCHTHADKYQLLAMALMSFLHKNDQEPTFAGFAGSDKMPDKMPNGEQMTCVFVFFVVNIYTNL